MLSIAQIPKMSPRASNENLNVISEWEFANDMAAKKSNSSSSDSVFLKSSKNGLAYEAALSPRISQKEQRRPLIYALTADIEPSVV